MNRTRSSLLWGLVGALTFLVLVQGYRLLVGQLGVNLLNAAGIALALGSVVSLVSYVAEPRLAAKGRT
ncbi:hypothetical protein [Halobellus rarus]|uniref:DUF7981 domain-containing protein n=1 Tax=Halobellus rarus TaxID=1126237 RepID=A0ABD6CK01_9EURY|nr:hypothetical protein [Halobellus rarus]